MRQRCNNRKNKSYKYYGERGIRICERWNKFENFLEDMGEAPKELTLERKDNDKGYSKDNCMWANWYKQNINRRTSVKNKSGTKGVCWRKDHKVWQVYIQDNGKAKHIGTFTDLEKAIEARRVAEHHRKRRN